MTTFAETINAMLQKWRTEGVSFASGARPELLQFFEQTYSVVIPADLRHYFLTVDGMRGSEHCEWDADMISFWQLPTANEIESPNETISHVAPLPAVWDSAPTALKDLFVIGDWSILCFVFCVRMTATASETSEIYFYDGDSPCRIASSLHQFLQQYVEHGIKAVWPNQ